MLIKCQGLFLLPRRQTSDLPTASGARRDSGFWMLALAATLREGGAQARQIATGFFEAGRTRTRGHRHGGPWGWDFPQENREDPLRENEHLWTGWGDRTCSELCQRGRNACLHLSPVCLRERRAPRGPPLLSPLPGSPYGMVSAQALGSSSWISRTLSMDFWAWDRACFAKLESWEALNQLISPQPAAAAAAAAPSGKAEGQADRPQARGMVHRNGLYPVFTRRTLSAAGHDPDSLPRDGDVTLGPARTAETKGPDCA